MEIFNIKIMYIVYFFSIILSEGIIINNFSQLCKNKVPINIKTFIILLLMSISVYFNNYYNFIYFRIIVGIAITGFYCHLIFKPKIKDTIYYAIVHSVIYIILEMLFSPLLSLVVNNITIFNNIFYLKSIFSISIGIISILILNNKKIINLIDKVYILINDSKTFLIILPLILLLINIMAVFRVIDLKNNYMLILSITTIFFMVICIRIIANDKYNLKIIKERNKNIKESYKAYSKTIEDCKEFKHNLKNELYSIKVLLPKKEQEKMNNILNKYNVNYEWINKIGEIPEGLQGMIYLKKKEAEQRKINVNINTTNTLRTCDNDYVDLCNIIGILLDNAIEASIKSKSKNIELVIYRDKELLKIRIINCYNNTINLMKIGKKNYSTKEYKSGLGLNYIKNIKNSKIKVSFRIINNLFITDINYV